MINMTRLRKCIGFFCFILIFGIAQADRKCDSSDLTGGTPCSLSEVCDGQTNSCQCQEGFERKNETDCIPGPKLMPQHPDPKSSRRVDSHGSGSIVAGVLIPLFLVIFVICVYVGRKYQVMTWVRNKLHRRNENYDEFMIGQDLDDDDPPLR